MSITHRTEQAQSLAAIRSQYVRTGHTERVTSKTPSEADLGTMMALQAAKDRKERSKRESESLLPPSAQPTGPSPAQAKTLAVIEGRVISADISRVLGCNVSQAGGYLSGLCEKGYVERVGFKGQSTIFRKTRLGRKTAQRLRAAQ